MKLYSMHDVVISSILPICCQQHCVSFLRPGTQWTKQRLASFPGLQSPNSVEGLVKLLRRMTSSQVDVWRRGLSHRACISTAVYQKCHASRRPPDIILCRSFTSPSTALAVIEGLGTRLAETAYNILSLVPRLSRNANMYHVESLVSFNFVRKHDVIKIGKKLKATFCALFNQLCFNARCVFDTRQLDTCSKLPATFVPFSVLSLIRPCTIKVASTIFYRFSCEKNTRLSIVS